MVHVVHELKIIFFHVPKTGGSAFKKSISERYRIDQKATGGDWEHTTAHVARNLIDTQTWDQFRKIAFVRHPVDWVLSFYLHDHNPCHRNYDMRRAFGEDTRFPFPKFVKLLTTTPYDFFTNPHDGRVLVDTIYRTEDMESVCDTYGLEMFRENERPAHMDVPAVDEITLERMKGIFHREYRHYE